MSKPGPSRIKVGLSRRLSYDEKKYFRDRLAKHGSTWEGETLTLIMHWEPWTLGGTYRAEFLNFRVRLSKNEQIYAESSELTSEELFEAVQDLVESHYVGVFPQAVKTLRELG